MHWLLIVDDCTGYTWSYFLHHKSELAEKVLKLIKDLKAKNIEVKYIWCDNAGENVAFREKCEQEGFGINFEFTAPGMPQQNGRVEHKFATLYGWVQAMLNDAKLMPSLRKKLWAEAANTATLLENHVMQNPQH